MGLSLVEMETRNEMLTCWDCKGVVRVEGSIYSNLVSILLIIMVP